MRRRVGTVATTELIWNRVDGAEHDRHGSAASQPPSRNRLGRLHTAPRAEPRALLAAQGRGADRRRRRARRVRLRPRPRDAAPDVHDRRADGGLPERDCDQLLRWSDIIATGGDEIRDEVGPAVIECAHDLMSIIERRRAFPAHPFEASGAVAAWTRWPPPCFAAYMAASAAPRSAATLSPCSG